MATEPQRIVEHDGERYVHIGGKHYMHIPKGQTAEDVLATMQRLKEDYAAHKVGKPTPHGAKFMPRRKRRAALEGTS